MGNCNGEISHLATAITPSTLSMLRAALSPRRRDQTQ
jgi:hypothetical protein